MATLRSSHPAAMTGLWAHAPISLIGTLQCVAQMSHFSVIDRREGTVAGCEASNLAAGPMTRPESAAAARAHAWAAGVITAAARWWRQCGAWPERTNLGRWVTEKEGRDGGS